MAFTGNNVKLIGDDGKLVRAVKNAEIAGNGATALPVGVYLVTAVAASSGFPANTTGTAIAAGDIIEVKTGITITPEVGDDVISLTLTDQCDISSWSMDFSKEEVETTTFCDTIKTFRAGKADMSGSMAGIFMTGITDATDGGLRGVIDIVKQDGATSFDRYAQQETILLGFFYTNKDSSISDVQYVVAPYQEYGRSLGGEPGSPQSFESSFKFANFSINDSTHGDISIEPTYYRQGDGS